MKPGPKPLSIERKFWAKVKRTDECWYWTASCSRKGYGQLVVKHGGTQKRWLAHRLSWVLHFGEIPKGVGYHGTCVLHCCDNPKCVRPDHLWLGSNADNVRDCIAKGRASKVRARGENHPMAKLTEPDIIAIRRDDRTQEIIAQSYGISTSTISAIQRREKWKHVA